MEEEYMEDTMNQTDENRLNDFADTLAELAEHIYGPEVAEFIRSHAPYRMKEKRQKEERPTAANRK